MMPTGLAPPRALPYCRPLLPRCSANPYGEHYLDGISLNPFEVLFVKASLGAVAQEMTVGCPAWVRAGGSDDAA